METFRDIGELKLISGRDNDRCQLPDAFTPSNQSLFRSFHCPPSVSRVNLKAILRGIRFTIIVFKWKDERGSV